MKTNLVTLTAACCALLMSSLTLQAAEADDTAAKTSAAAAPAKTESAIAIKPCGMNHRHGPGSAFRAEMHAEMERIINTKDHDERHKLFTEHRQKMQARMSEQMPMPKIAPGQLRHEMEQGERRQDMETMMHTQDPAARQKMMMRFQEKMQRQMRNRHPMMQPRPNTMMPPQGAFRPSNGSSFGMMPPPGVMPGMPSQMSNRQAPAPQQRPTQQQMMQMQIENMERQIQQMKARMQQMQ